MAWIDITRSSERYGSTILEHDVPAKGGETVVLEDKASGYNVSRWQVTQQLYNGDYVHEIRFFKINCSRLTVRTTRRRFASNPISSTGQELVGLISPGYMLPRSQLNYTICIRSRSSAPSHSRLTRDHTSQANLFVFDSEKAYLAYLNHHYPLPPAAYSQQLPISTRQACYSIQFTTNHSSHYGIGVAVDSSVVYQYNYSLLILHYNASQYQSNCNVSGDGKLCTIDMQLNDSNTCLLSYVVPYPPALIVPSSTHIHVITTPRLHTSSYPLPSCCVLLAVMFVLTTVSMTAVGYNYLLPKERKKQKHGKEKELKSTFLA